jgi:hypothetical protein
LIVSHLIKLLLCVGRRMRLMYLIHKLIKLVRIRSDYESNLFSKIVLASTLIFEFSDYYD